MKTRTSSPQDHSLPTAPTGQSSWRHFKQAPRKLFFALGLAALLATGAAHAQPIVLDCSCLSTQAILFTNGCCGIIPDLCTVATNCYLPSLAPAPGFTCTQSPLPGTPVCGTTPITFTLTENTPAAFSTTCTVNYVTGFTTNRFMILCPPTQVLPCNTTNLVFPTPVVTNLVPCCTNPVIITGPVLVTNWPVITASWIAMQCGVVDFCKQTFVFANNNGLPCQCLDIFCPSNIVVQTCLGLPGTSNFGLTNIFYPPPVVTNTCLGVITNVTTTPPSGSPFPVGTNTVTCTVYDNLGNVATCTFDVIVLGNTTPPVVTCGSNQVVQCGSAWAPIPPTAVSSCCTNFTIQLFGSVTNFSGPCSETIDFFWHVMDCNGNFANCTNTVTVIDTTPPVIVCNSNQTYQCGSTAGWTPIPPTATDNCCPNPTVSLVSAVTNNPSPCNEVITLTWKAVDCCTNTSFCTEVINIVDTTPPVINCQPFKQIECGTGPNWFGDYPTAFDACCGTNVTIALINVVTNFQSTCFSRYTLTWTATDCCTNTSGPCIEVLQIVDTTPPNVICPTNKIVQCGTTWNFNPPIAVDDCCTNPPTISVISTVTNGPGNCPLVVTRNWQITDCCGNATNCSQTVTVIDNVPPVITCGANQTVPCGSAWSFIPPTAFDACCGTNVFISLVSAVTNNNNGTCVDTIAAIWQAVDCCGNKSICTNFVTLIDNIPPVITCRSNYVVQCGSPILPPPATDNCCPNPTVTILNAITNGIGPCNQILTITWQAQDCCTNTSTCTEVITVTDTTPPVVTCAPNKTIQCGTPVTFDPPTAFDACCGTNITISVLSTSPLFGTACSSSTTRTWIITDCCTNSTTCSQTVTVVDTTPPIINCGFTNQTVQCGSVWTFGGPPTATDACCNNVTVALVGTGTSNPSPCTTVHSQTWSATDCCGNVSFCTRTITEVDTVPPTITCASNFTVNVGTPWTFTTPTAFDACCGPTLIVMATTTNIVGCQVMHTRYWKAVDCCGNSSPICSQTVTVNMTPPPNDPCSNPFPLVLNGAYICGSNICATPSLPGTLNPTPCGASIASPDVWYTVTAICTAPLTVDLCPPCPPHPTFDTVLSAYTGPCNALTQVGPTACNDDACGLRSIITFPAVAGQTYRIRVAGYFGAVGWFSIRATQTVSPPPNDLCANAIVISNLNSSLCGSTLCGATPTPLGTLVPTPCGASVNSPDVWYKFTPQCNGAITITTCGTCPPAGTFDTVLSVYTGNCSLLNQVAGGCNDDAGPNGPCPWTLQSYVSFIPVPGVTYYIRVAGFITSVGDFRLNINQAPTTPPPNDLCANATVVNAGSYAWNNCSANTDGPGNPCGLQNDVWFRYTPVCSGTIMINTCLSSINTALAVYTGNCNALSLVGCNSSALSGSCAGSGQSYMTFNGVAGTTYRIRVGSSSAVTGNGILNIVGPSPIAVPTCGSGSVVWHWYLIQGTGNNIPWAWSASSPCCSNMRNLNVPGVTGSAFVLATAFANSINAQCASTALAIPINASNAFLGIATRCGPGAPLILQVGPAGTAPLNMCVVSGFLLPTTGPCSFNPDIYEVELSGQDANNNGIDDYIDIASGTSADVNGDMIPDEAQNCFGPQVTAKPDSQLVELGQSVSLHVAVGGIAPFSYQWLLNGVPITGATNDTLTVNPVAAADLGDYGVTVSNACGTLDGTAANIYVTPTSLPVLYDASLADGWFRFMVETKIGYDYVIEYKDDLREPAWTTLSTVPGTGAPQLIYDSEPPPEMRYYRVRQQPQSGL